MYAHLQLIYTHIRMYILWSLRNIYLPLETLLNNIFLYWYLRLIEINMTPSTYSILRRFPIKMHYTRSIRNAFIAWVRARTSLSIRMSKATTSITWKQMYLNAIRRDSNRLLATPNRSFCFFFFVITNHWSASSVLIGMFIVSIHASHTPTIFSYIFFFAVCFGVFFCKKDSASNVQI